MWVSAVFLVSSCVSPYERIITISKEPADTPEYMLHMSWEY